MTKKQKTSSAMSKLDAIMSTMKPAGKPMKQPFPKSKSTKRKFYQ